ncbi:DUF4091 domain-containing protein [Enterococcus gallinarum]|uniref:DUF4091 domain-containing protein n=1 Tax=Enterococcus gallinarum TaxID=1353 RepID=UPI0012E13A8F|nr:DUF4091 domain-containing protein [Enterococcus gallinarum]MUO32391.1 DUF4091 domain-containing protein [Enterococcus gallinarum]
MKAWLVHESYKADTNLFTELPNELSTVKGCKNSFAACQLLLHDGNQNHFIIGREFSIPDEIEIPMYRIEIKSELPVASQFVDFYTGQENIDYADKLLDQTAKTYPGDRMASVYLEFSLAESIAAGSYPVEISLYRSQMTGADSLVLSKKMTVEVSTFAFPIDYRQSFNLDVWQQPSILARTYKVPLWSEEHFRLVEEMARSLADIGQKAVTVIAGEIPWKGWFNYIVKDYPANLYEYSIIKVRKTKSGTIDCDFSVLDRYLNCFFRAGIDQEINVFGLLGVWQPPFFPTVDVDYPERLVVRYYDEETGLMCFIQQKEDLKEYISQVFGHFKELGIWEKVRIISDEPKKNQIRMFKDSLAELKAIDETLQVKVAFDKEDVMNELLALVDYPVTSYYCTCNHYEELNQSHPEKTQYYICNYPDKPNTFLRSPLLETRVQGILAHHFKTDGLLRWAYNCWPENAREDIRYNTRSYPIGDLCLIYPSYSGHLALSLRYKQLQRGIEDFYLVKQAERQQPEQTADLLDTFLTNPNSQEWMVDSHQSQPDLFLQTASDYEALRDALLTIIEK